VFQAVALDFKIRLHMFHQFARQKKLGEDSRTSLFSQHKPFPFAEVSSRMAQVGSGPRKVPYPFGVDC
jgi:hypothetical protein